MAKSKPKKGSKKTRTKEIKVNEGEPKALPTDKSEPKPEKHYELHIGQTSSTNQEEGSTSPDKSEETSQDQKPPTKPNAASAQKKAQKKLNRILTGPGEFSASNKPQRTKISTRIWNFLEWAAISGLIFMGLFLALNWQSYSMLLKNKLDKLTGNFELNPFIAQEFQPEENMPQELLPPSDGQTTSTNQIPKIDFDVTPPDDRIIIPRINKNVPVVPVSTQNLIRRDWDALENDIQGALQSGVVHYPGTAHVGQKGNVVLTGHSSYFPWDPGRFKDVFALLHEIVVGDQIVVYQDQTKALYEVYETRVVTPDQVDVLTQEGEDRLTLITCTPVGTNLKRLVVFARPVE